MKIFLTGGTGFIGSHLINAATDRGIQVVALRREHSSPRVILSRQPEWVTGDLRADHTKKLAECDVLMHLASVGVSPQPATYDNCYYWNVYKSLLLIEDAVKVGVKRIVTTGTYAEYGRSSNKFNQIPVNCQLDPIGPYASSKVAFSVGLESLLKQYGATGHYLRLFSVYGIGQHQQNLYPALCEAAYKGRDFPITKGEQIRDFIDVSSTVEQILDRCHNKTLQNASIEYANIGTGKGQSIFDFCMYHWVQSSATGQLLRGALPYRDSEIMHCVADLTSFTKEL